jgi:2,3-bisphosphoglycerate-independent phosphoglycerate mutase
MNTVVTSGHTDRLASAPLRPKVYLMILDGFGEGKDYPGNAVKKAKMPNLNGLKAEYPMTLLQASGNAVGLPEGTQGGSEVGHFTIGAGRIVYQTLEEINKSIRDESFFTKKPLLDAAEIVKKGDKAALHLIGMISDQGIHSDIRHLFALLEFAKRNNVGPVYIHAITDGRDVPERSAKPFIEQIQNKIKELGLTGVTTPTASEFANAAPGITTGKSTATATIATIIGRYYAMDRDTNWDRTQKAYDLLTSGTGTKETDTLKAIDNAYARGIETDYYIDPIILDERGLIKENDAVIFFNYRTDRTRQLTRAFTREKEIGFTPQKTVRPFFVCFGEYSDTAPVVFPAPKVTDNLGAVLGANKIPQLRIAETEKYAHVTFFFNSQMEEPNPGETRIMIDSPKVPSYADKPEMSAHEITDRVLREIDTGKYRVIIQNFANPDLVGHSGDFNATVKACEVVDECIGKIVTKAKENGYAIIITADHGNAEYKIYEENGDPCPSHSLNPVICVLVSDKYKTAKMRSGCGLRDVAPTILKILDIQKPREMTGESLIEPSEKQP